jgi:hypothetical protein
MPAMTHDIKDAQPEGCEDKECTHQHIVAERITVKPPGCKASVTIMGNSGATGIWVQSGNGNEMVGLIAQAGVGPALVIWDQGYNGIPLAVSHDHIQLPSEHPARSVVTIPFADLLAAVRQVVKPAPQ